MDPMSNPIVNPIANLSSGSATVPRRDFLRTLGLAVGVLSLSQASRVLAQAGTKGAAQQPQPPRKPAPAGKAAAVPAAASAPRTIVIYKDPNCGCCKEWVTHMKAAGFVATVHYTADMATVKRSMGVPTSFESCHTARVGSYTIEGHVPADVIEKLLREKPVALGLAVPGMPMGSPGMEGPRKDKYDVMLFEKNGKSRVYASR
ncbi:MAG TPA: DUF411 domain-containing protein [Gemmatimonas sp.]|nr:DUF411 domain-containing protein [Gemmatimonas sp.]